MRNQSALFVLLLLLHAACIGANPMGLFVSVTGLLDNQTGAVTPYGQATASALDLICKRGFNVTTNPNRVHSLALDHLASPTTGEYLAQAVAFLEPSFECFDRVYIGQADNHGVHDMYCTGLLNKSYTANYVDRSLATVRHGTALPVFG